MIVMFLYSIVFGQTNQEKIEALNKKLADLQDQQTQIKLELEDYKLIKIRKDLDEVGIPYVRSDEVLINHSAMSLVYSEFHEQAKWVAHIITPDIIEGKYSRTNDFRPDKKIESGSAIEQDYFLKYMKPDSTYEYDGFGYDRGHLAPSADFRWSAKAISESYLYSNMSPQVADFNRGKWGDLEGLLRGYIYNNPTTQLYVVTGPILNKKLPHIERGTNKVTIPKQYFKIAIDIKNNRGIAFLMPNKNIQYPIASFAKSIDEIEELTGIDFYHSLADSIENEIEKQSDVSLWIPEKNKQDVKPISAPSLPANYFNTVQAKLYVGESKKVNVCGKVVGTKISKNGHVFLNLDQSFPNQIFTVAIWKKNHPNFSYDIIKKWKGKTICLEGKVVDFGGTPTMILEKEDEITPYSELSFQER